MNTVKKISHRKLGKHKADGLAWPNGTIEIDERLVGLNHLETLIHEIIHIQNPSWSEKKVLRHSKEMAAKIWEQNYRWVELAKK